MHASYTPVDTVSFGGNFMHTYDFETTVRAIELERKINPRGSFHFIEVDFVEYICGTFVTETNYNTVFIYFPIYIFTLNIPYYMVNRRCSSMQSDNYFWKLSSVCGNSLLMSSIAWIYLLTIWSVLGGITPITK